MKTISNSKNMKNLNYKYINDISEKYILYFITFSCICIML